MRQREGIYFFCDLCGGRALTLPQLRRVAGDRFAAKLLHLLNLASEESPRACPFCRGRMKQFQISQPELALDTCRPCDVVWFDPSEFEAIPEGGVESPDALQLRGREALAEHKVTLMAEQAAKADPAPDEGWKWLPAFLGLPVKLEDAGLSRWPWITWSLSALIALVSVCSFFDLKSVISHLGMVPAELWRYGGATLLTSFFLHGGVWHLVSNLYFFLLFGNNVEDYIGRWRFALLILAATLTGDMLHILGNPQSMTPCIGASGGISGVITFYALEFPRARLGFLLRLGWRYTWIQVPASGALVLWFLLQVFGAFEQMVGFSNVSSLAHLGGGGAGIALWLWWRKLGKSPVEGQGSVLLGG